MLLLLAKKGERHSLEVIRKSKLVRQL